MTRFQIQLLGNFQIQAGETAVTSLNTERLQAVFCYLLMHTQTPQPRHYIAATLWPNATDSQARTNLRKILHRLRHKLPPIEQLLHITPHTIQWRPEASATVDVHHFEYLLTQAATAQKQNNHKEASNALTKAVALYQGDLLPACYENWIAAPRERLASQYIQALDQLAHLLTEQTQYNQAIPYVQQLLEQDTLRESSYRRLIHLHMLVGNRAKALATYHQCEDVLRRELGVAPSSATQALYGRLQTPPQHTKQTAIQQTVLRQQMTFLWVDLAGFSRLSQQHDPQSFFTDFNAYMNLIARLIEKGGGQVVKRMGDAVLGMFAQANTALATAFTIQNELRLFNNQQVENGRPPFPTRIGIATGAVLIINLQSDSGQHEVEVMGKCVTTAMRLQTVSPINGIALDQLTYNQCQTQIKTAVTETILKSDNGNERVYTIATQ